jgi:CspA family cold shock protein
LILCYILYRIYLVSAKERANTMKGTVKKFDKEKGYGFITGEDGKDYFFHYSQLMMDGFKTAEVGQKVSFDETTTEKGLRANNIHLEND